MQARIPEPNGEVVITRYSLRELQGRARRADRRGVLMAAACPECGAQDPPSAQTCADGRTTASSLPAWTPCGPQLASDAIPRRPAAPGRSAVEVQLELVRVRAQPELV